MNEICTGTLNVSNPSELAVRYESEDKRLRKRERFVTPDGSDSRGSGAQSSVMANPRHLSINLLGAGPRILYALHCFPVLQAVSTRDLLESDRITHEQVPHCVFCLFTIPGDVSFRDREAKAIANVCLLDISPRVLTPETY